MIYSDQDIKQAINDGDIVVENGDEQFIHCASWDFRLADMFIVAKNGLRFTGNEEGINLEPGEFILGATKEKITLSDKLVARVEGRSSLGRMGIMVHSTAGFIDPGFSGTITLEIKNINNVPVTIYPNQRICQLCFEELKTPCETSYGDKVDSKYQGQVEPTPSRIDKDRENN